MSDDMITPDNVSKELLKEVYDAALMDVDYDDDGDLRVTDRIKCFVLPKDNRIRFLSLFGSNENASFSDLIEFANRVNNEYIVIRVSITDKKVVSFDYDMWIQGGITKKNLVMSTRRFLSIPLEACEEHGRHLLR